MRIGLVLGWIFTPAGIAAIFAGCVMDPANWWYIAPGIVGTVVGLIILAVSSDSDWVPDFVGNMADSFMTISLFEMIEDLF